MRPGKICNKCSKPTKEAKFIHDTQYGQFQEEVIVCDCCKTVYSITKEQFKERQKNIRFHRARMKYTYIN